MIAAAHSRREIPEAELSDWHRRIGAVARKVCGCRDLDEVIADSWGELWIHCSAGKPVREPAGLIRAIVAKCADRRRRRSRWLLVDSSMVLAAQDGAATEPEAGSGEPPQEVLRSLRGSRQRWILKRVCAGWTCRRIAAELGWPIGEVHRHVERLTRRLRERDR